MQAPGCACGTSKEIVYTYTYLSAWRKNRDIVFVTARRFGVWRLTTRCDVSRPWIGLCRAPSPRPKAACMWIAKLHLHCTSILLVRFVVHYHKRRWHGGLATCALRTEFRHIPHCRFSVHWCFACLSRCGLAVCTLPSPPPPHMEPLVKAARSKRGAGMYLGLAMAMKPRVTMGSTRVLVVSLHPRRCLVCHDAAFPADPDRQSAWHVDPLLAYSVLPALAWVSITLTHNRPPTKRPNPPATI